MDGIRCPILEMQLTLKVCRLWHTICAATVCMSAALQHYIWLQYVGNQSISTLDATSYIHKTTFGPDLTGSVLTSNGRMSNISLSTSLHMYTHLLHNSSIRTGFDRGLNFLWKVRNPTYPKYKTFKKTRKINIICFTRKLLHFAHVQWARVKTQ